MDKKIKKNGIRITKKQALLSIYTCLFLLFIFCKYQFCYYTLDFKNPHGTGYSIFGGFFIVIILMILAIIINFVLGRKTHLFLYTILLLWLIFSIPLGDLAREAYLNENIELFSEAVEYAKEQDNGEGIQKIILPEKYDDILMYSIKYVYLIKEEEATKVFFIKGGFLEHKGFLYVEATKSKKEEMKERYWPLFEIKKEQEGFWTWVVIQEEDLYTEEEKIRDKELRELEKKYR